MAGSGPAAKHPGTRQRVNRKSTRATLYRDGNRKIPRIPHHPGGAWHPQALDFWHELWLSPMAQEYDPKTDLHGLFTLVLAYDDFLRANNARERQAASSEMRLVGAQYGINPMARR